MHRRRREGEARGNAACNTGQPPSWLASKPNPNPGPSSNPNRGSNHHGGIPESHLIEVCRDVGGLRHRPYRTKIKPRVSGELALPESAVVVWGAYMWASCSHCE